jgi:hypothetical protein
MTDTPLASVFSGGRYVGAILHRGPKGFEAVAESGESHGCFPSQKEAAMVLQERALHDCVGCGIELRCCTVSVEHFAMPKTRAGEPQRHSLSRPDLEIGSQQRRRALRVSGSWPPRPSRGWDF